MNSFYICNETVKELFEYRPACLVKMIRADES